jgi:hypothetical protein
MRVTVKKIGRTWAVMLGERLIEGGFFFREAAEQAARELRAQLAVPRSFPEKGGAR